MLFRKVFKGIAMHNAIYNNAARADELENGVGAYKKGNYARALELLKPIAEEGNAMAQGLLGRIYLRGEGISQDHLEAAKWHRLAAEQGDRYSQHTLGSSYYYGVGVTQDYSEAAKWYRLAAKQGHAVAQDNLGWMYDEGKGVTQDYQEAAKWHRLASEQ
jgi:TPR repeat protein